MTAIENETLVSYTIGVLILVTREMNLKNVGKKPDAKIYNVYKFSCMQCLHGVNTQRRKVDSCGWG